MSHYRFLGSVVLAWGLIVAIGASTAHCQHWDPLGIQDHHEYQPFGKYGPKLRISVINPDKVRSGGSLGEAKRKAARRSAPRQRTRLDAQNLTVTMPRGRWVKLDPKKTGSRACYMISRRDPEIVVSLAGEPAATEAADTNSTLLAKSQEKMKSFSGCTIESQSQKLSAVGIPGVVYTATIVDGQSVTYYSIWVAAHRGYNYQLAVYGDQKQTVDAITRDFVRGIRPIQSTNVARRNTNKSTVTR